MPGALLPFMDGEAIPDEAFGDIFRYPPGVSTQFTRSALLIGSRGVGKTTLLRFLKSKHSGVACHINLAAELSSITKQASLGAFSIDAPKEVADLMAAKAGSLLVAVVADRLVKRNLQVATELVGDCVPSQCVPRGRLLDRKRSVGLISSLAVTDLRDFGALAYRTVLPEALARLAQVARKQHGPLLLLFDRADMVPQDTLVPVFEVLDQSEGFVALVALRPGHAGELLARSTGAAKAGDHFGIVHLGAEPYSEEWLRFLLSAVQAQIGQRLMGRIGAELQVWMATLARDSVRGALEVAHRCTSDTSGVVAAFDGAQLDARENLLSSCQAVLQVYRADFRRVVAELREDALHEHGKITGPVVVSIKETTARLFDGSPRVDRFLGLALRSGAMVMPTGLRWTPGLRLDRVEVPPVLIWQKGDQPWSSTEAQEMKLLRAPSGLISARGGSAPNVSIFVAYRMKVPESMAFRRELEVLVGENPALEGATVIDGHLPAGMRWPDTIRQRVKSARVVVGDVTGVRPEVTFELGFAFGLKRPVVPVVADPSDVARLPRWLTELQVGCYQDGVGMVGIAASITAHMAGRNMTGLPKAPDPVPGVAVWIGRAAWAIPLAEVFETQARQAGLKPELLSDDLDEDRVLASALRGVLVVLAFDGGRLDPLKHFLAGAVAARPTAGVGGPRLYRRVIVLVEDQASESLLAEGMRRCAPTVEICRRSMLPGTIQAYGKTYQHWARSAVPSGDEVKNR